MAQIVNKIPVGDKSFFLTLTDVKLGKAGQFYMLRSGDSFPLLPRPISIFDIDENAKTATLFIDIVGEGTKMLSKMNVGDFVEASAPYGNGFPVVDGDVTLIGGACGTAPLYLLAKTLLKSNPTAKINTYIGYSYQSKALDYFKTLFEKFGAVTTDVGGYITNKVDFSRNATFFACGPTPMMKAVKREAESHDKTAYLSLENRMACGVGACLACSCATISGNKRVCKDGPVFDSKEIIYD